MIEYWEKLILDNWTKWVKGEKPEHLDFLKTHAGQATRNKKVGFFVFAGKLPIIFIKTVREKAHNQTIENEFKTLTKAYQLVKNDSIPRPIHCEIYQEISFSLEEAFVGKQFHSFRSESDLNKFLEWFFGFQKSMLTGEILNGNNLGKHFKDIVEKFLSAYALDEDLKNSILYLVGKFGNFDNVRLQLINQHGDLTPDNVLDCDGKIKVIDWANFGKINLPLFDLLVFLQRWSKTRDISFIDKYSLIIGRYLDEFGIDRNLLERLVFIHYLLDFMRKKETLEAYDKEYLSMRLEEIKNRIK